MTQQVELAAGAAAEPGAAEHGAIPPGVGWRGASLPRNVLSNWSNTGAAIVYSLIITPIVVRALDKELYGIWSFLNGLLAYSNLLYLGLGAALVKYVAHHRAAGDQDELNRLASVVLTIYTLVGLLCIGIAIALGPFVPRILSQLASPSAERAAVVTCLLLGFRLFFMFVGSVFSGVIVGQGRTDVYNLVGVSFTVVRFVAVPLLLPAASPLVMLAAIVTVTSGLETVALLAAALRIDPRFRPRPAIPRGAELKVLYGFGLLSFFVQLSEKLISYTDTTVIGVRLGAASVALYALPLQLAEYGRLAIYGIVLVLLPHLTMLHARGDVVQLRATYLKSIRFTVFLAVFVNVNLMFLGRPFLALWVGPDFAEPARWVIGMLAVASIFQALSTQTQIPFAQALHTLRFPVAVLLTEAALNLVLSIYLTRPLGINGVALATVVPAGCCTLLLIPRYVANRLSVPLRRLAVESLWPSIVLALSLVAMHVIAEVIGTPHSYGGIFARALITVPVALAAAAITFPQDERALALHYLQTIRRVTGLNPRAKRRRKD